jgi:hypothetical protein
MSSNENHQGRAETALSHARRFITAAGHCGEPDGSGSAWRSGVTLTRRISHVSSARMFAELAVHEAAHARPVDVPGPTLLQVEASKLADICTRMTVQLAHDIERGALKGR